VQHYESLKSKVKELHKELELRMEEHSSNLKQKDQRIQELDIQVQVNYDKVKQVQGKMEAKDREN
jgi:2C-methyl-D-erythritol 2,4-cyclodiphosphate synthase